MGIRTFKLGKKLMEGSDVKEFQELLVREFRHMKIVDVPLNRDGVYGPTTRSITACLLKASGINMNVLKKGVTPELQRKLRDRKLTKGEEERRHSSEIKLYRAELRHRWDPPRRLVHTPVAKILADSWGFHPGVHDGLDLICPADAVIFAMVRSKVIDVRSSGWWGKAPSGNVSLGDGIIQLEVLEDTGPFRKGMHIGYGHAEKARVKVGQIVNAGDPIGHAGLAVAWHVHLMVNDGKTSKGIGNINPERFYRYAVNND